ncbi:hypothetical protein HTG_00505 [Natrinema mahii]|nr:hypothetical protein HTG_00505 [Natrinema mahii]
MSQETVTEETLDSPTTGSASVWADQVRAFAGRNLREIAHSWTLLSIALGFGPFLYLVYLMAWDSVPAPMRASLAVGLGTFGSMLVCLYVFGNQLVVDIEASRYELYRAMPVRPSADLVGRMIAGLTISCVAFLSTLLAGGLTGASFGIRGPESVPIVVAAFALSCLLWMVVAVPIVIAANNERYAEFLTTMVAVVAVFVTGNNGVVPEMSMVDGELLNVVPNALSARLLGYHLVGGGEYARAGLVPPPMPSGLESVALLGLYGVGALALGIAFVRTSLYDNGGDV